MTWFSTSWGACPGQLVRMMTCVSDRSGSASSGVRSMDTTPQAVIITVAIRTRKRLAMLQWIRRAIIVALPGPRVRCA
ncbi:hypothetical protein D9M69_685660 [compost metagenome]